MRSSRGLWTVDYRAGGVWRVAVVRAGFVADAIETVRRREGRRLTDVTVVPGDAGLFAQGYPRSRIIQSRL